MRKFDTGATRDTDAGKHDIEAFIDPLVMDEFFAYMHRKRVQPDGALRAGDNWQKGIPISVYQKSLIRHVWAAWRAWRTGQDYHDELCAILFNAMGLMRELRLERFSSNSTFTIYPSGNTLSARRQIFGHPED